MKKRKTMTIPSELLQGQIISGWTVEKQTESYPGQTGGFFSRGYIVSKDGKKAFLKAMDLHKVMGRPLKEIGETISQYEFERQLFELCSKAGLSHIVRMVDQGELVPDKLKDFENQEFYRVFYMIFEFASGGDVRRELSFEGAKTCSWKLYVLHQVAVALTQLHGIGIVHQDVKPSNILVFKEKKQYKLTDLGRSNSKSHSAPTDEYQIPGDMNYAPLEYFYGFKPADYNDRRIGSDIYLLGSILSFLYLGLGALTLTRAYISKEYWHNEWAGNYKEVLPFLIDAHTQATQAFSKALVGNKFQNELSSIYFQLCHPDPAVRGNPKSRHNNSGLGLDRYVTQFDRFSKELEIQERVMKVRDGN